eukprot:177159_1
MGSVFSQTESVKAKLNILCFGASLVAGFYKDWDNWYLDEETQKPNATFYSPFSNTLQSLIISNFKMDKSELNIVTRGVPGQCAVNMMDRLNKCLKEHKNIQFDLVMICAGTNDIAWVKDTQKIIDKIIEMHAFCHTNGIKSVIITIPECERQNDAVIQKRNEINNSLKQYADSNPNNVMLFDLYSKLKYHCLDTEKKELYWNDGLHFTPVGYKYWGQMIYQFLLPWIQQIYKQKFMIAANNT